MPSSRKTDAGRTGSRRRRPGRPRLAVAGGVLSLCCLALLLAYGGTLVDLATRAQSRFEHRLGMRLDSRHGVGFLATFDEAVPRDAVSGARIDVWGAPRVAGRHGFARRIAPDRGGSVVQTITPFLATSHTVATYMLWIRPDDIERRQTLLRVGSALHTGMELLLEGGQIVARLSVPSVGVEEMKCPYPAGAKGFVHVALAIGKRKAALYVNGREGARTSLPERAALPPRAFVFTSDDHDPFFGDIDEVAVCWRPLLVNEIARVATSRRDIRWLFEPWKAALADASRVAVRALRAFYRVCDRLRPSRMGLALMRADLPAMTLRMKKNDERHFVHAHERSLGNGYRTAAAGKFRTIGLVVGGKAYRVQLALDDVYGRADDIRRPAFLLNDPDRVFLDGCGLARLYPPELHVAIHPDAAEPLPLHARFIRLYLDDSFRGLYVMEPFDAPGGAWMARGRRDPNFRKALHFASAPRLCDVPPPGVSAEDAFRAVAASVVTDTLFPWSAQELRARRAALARERRDMAFADHSDAVAPVSSILGANPAALYVTGDLVLDAPGVAWRSSDHAVLADDGRVTRPADGRPRNVRLHAEDTRTGASQDYRLRVMPASPALPALFLGIGAPIEKFRRSDFTCLRIPEGDGRPEWFAGTLDTKGGVRHRGNTSYVKGAKRSMSLEFDVPVPWPDACHPAQHVVLYSGYADPTRLRNKVAFDAFRLGGGDFPHIAPEISWAEVFVNGEYFGVWETSRRARDICPEGALAYKVRAWNDALWATTDTTMTDCATPHDSRQDAYAPLADLFAFTSQPSDESFAAGAASRLWLDNLATYFLVLNFSDNRDGRVTNQYIVQAPGDPRWFILPWDYDKTFFADSGGRLSNWLVDRLYAQVPAFREKVRARWREMRAGPLSDAAVFGRIEADAALLAPYMADEFRLLQPLGEDGDFAAAVAKLKASAARQLAAMDAVYLK